MKHQKTANWFFGGAALFFGMAFYIRLHEESLWASLLYFAAQSALIGGAADWFAVTALFRKPLGFPFHTALIPRNRKRIVGGIRRMVENKLIRPELWQQLFGAFSAAGTLRTFLETERGKTLENEMAAKAFQIGQGLLLSQNLVTEDSISQALPNMGMRLRNSWKQKLAEKDMADRLFPVFLSLVELFLKKESTRDLLITSCKRWTGEQKKNPLISMAISMGESMGLIHYGDMADALVKASLHQIDTWKAAESPMQTEIKDKICQILSAVTQMKEMDAALLVMAEGILKSSLDGSLAANAAKCVKDQWDMEGKSVTQSLLADGIQTILSDRTICGRLDREVQNLFINLALYEHSFLGETAEAVLTAYDDEQLNAFVEDKVGEELGWIRINGMWVAASAGAVLFILILLIRHIQEL